ncbi:hypothetical protein PGH24_08285 [Thermoanaerobacterium thermosaccharolyticum]|uniref:hypothetical protein n=1 Tax=Thermoanaerobacterium thermosaccharolyticum TaxID=1517 RepID=UPI00279F3951|nr:hypothetical protein PGH24_08285 [Thermoanaerobacterium thermosaccharolyticum]
MGFREKDSAYIEDMRALGISILSPFIIAVVFYEEYCYNNNNKRRKEIYYA